MQLPTGSQPSLSCPAPRLALRGPSLCLLQPPLWLLGQALQEPTLYVSGPTAPPQGRDQQTQKWMDALSAELDPPAWPVPAPGTWPCPSWSGRSVQELGWHSGQPGGPGREPSMCWGPRRLGSGWDVGGRRGEAARSATSMKTGGATCQAVTLCWE